MASDQRLDKPVNGGYADAPWKPKPRGAPPIWTQVGQPQTGDSLPPWAPGPEPGSKANADLEPATAQDAFAALDALADELGPLPEVDVSPLKARKVSKGICKNARDIAALKNPELAAIGPPPEAPPPMMSTFTSLPEAVKPLQEVKELGGTSPSSKQQEVPQQFTSALGALPGPQQFMISDSPQKDDDNHSWDDDVPDAEDRANFAEVMATAEAQGEGTIEDDDPWDSEPDEPTARARRQPGASEGQGVDHNSWDSEDEDETKVVKRRGKIIRKKSIQQTAEDRSMQDLDDLVAEVVDGQKRLAVPQHLPDFRCTQCDNAVICFVGFEWAAEVDYLFFRNFHGIPEKLRPKLNASSDNTAYCCQCSWKTTASSVHLKAVGADSRWRIIS